MCRQEAADYINATAAYMFNLCLTHETIRRTIWLEKLRKRAAERECRYVLCSSTASSAAGKF